MTFREILWSNFKDAINPVTQAKFFWDEVFVKPNRWANEHPDEVILFLMGGELSALECSTYSAIKPGPLPADIAETFSGGRYVQRVLQQDSIYYRVWGGKAGMIGRRGTFLSSNPQVGGLQSQIDEALKYGWGNTATNVTQIKIPAGTTVFEGITSSQGGACVGGTPQTYVPQIKGSWALP